MVWTLGRAAVLFMAGLVSGLTAWWAAETLLAWWAAKRARRRQTD